MFFKRYSCVYITTYLGNKMPNRYIGSVYTDRIINENYHGSVVSKKWKDIWENEIAENPELFSTEILLEFTNRNEATNFEEILQRKLDVVNSIEYINESYAKKSFSCKGMSWTLNTETKNRRKTNSNSGMKGKKHSAETISKMKKNHVGTTGKSFNKGQVKCRDLRDGSRYMVDSKTFHSSDYLVGQNSKRSNYINNL